MPTNSSTFDPLHLTEEQQSILVAFFARRKVFDTFLAGNGLPLFTCPSCGFPSLESRGGYEICIVCFWEDDLQDDEDADKVKGGPNGRLSLTEGRLEVGEKLLDIIRTEGGSNNGDGASVIRLIALYDTKLRDISKSIPGDVTRDHPGYALYYEMRQRMLRELVLR